MQSTKIYLISCFFVLTIGCNIKQESTTSSEVERMSNKETSLNIYVREIWATNPRDTVKPVVPEFIFIYDMINNSKDSIVLPVKDILDDSKLGSQLFLVLSNKDTIKMRPNFSDDVLYLLPKDSLTIKVTSLFEDINNSFDNSGYSDYMQFIVHEFKNGEFYYHSDPLDLNYSEHPTYKIPSPIKVEKRKDLKIIYNDTIINL